MRFRFELSAIVAATALASCGVNEASPDPDASGTDAVDMTPEGPSMLSKMFGGGKPMPLDIQQAHANGVVLQLTSIQAKPSETVITAIIINGDDNEQSLNRNNNKNTYLVLGDGSKLYLSPPTANPKLEVQAGQRMQAELVFLGRLPAGSQATLFINNGDSIDNEYTSMPGFRIPLPLTEAAFSDDGSKKN